MSDKIDRVAEALTAAIWSNIESVYYELLTEDECQTYRVWAKSALAAMDTIPDQCFIDDMGRKWEWCGGTPDTWEWRMTDPHPNSRIKDA
jgi:hypothetical protein